MELPSDGVILSKFGNHLKPDEVELYYIIGQREPSSSIKFIPVIGKLLYAIMIKSIFVGLTNRRLLIMQVSWGSDEKNLKSIELSEIKHFKVEDPIMAKIVPFSLVEKTLCLTLDTGEEYKIKAFNKSDRVRKQEENMKEICSRLEKIADSYDLPSETDIKTISLSKEIRKPKWPQLEKRTELLTFPSDLLENIKESKETERHYIEVIEINPENAIAHYNYAKLLENMKIFEEAAKHYIEAIEINPEFVELYKQMHIKTTKTRKFLSALGFTVGFVVITLLFYLLIYLLKKGIWELLI